MQNEVKPQMQAPQASDGEGAMARADLYRAAKNAMKLFQMVQEGQELEGWVQAKITKSADYLDSVYHYMEYKMKFGGGGQASSVEDITGEAEMGSANTVSEEDDEKPITDMEESMNYEQRLHALLESAKKKAMMKKCPPMSHIKKMCQDGKSVAEICKMHPDCDQKELKQMVADCKKKLSEGKTEVQYDKDGKRTGVKHTSTHKYTDEPHTEPKSQAKSKSAAEKAGDKAADKAQAQDTKDYEKKNPGSVKRYKDGKLVSETADSKKAAEDKKKKENTEEKKKKIAKIMDEASFPVPPGYPAFKKKKPAPSVPPTKDNKTDEAKKPDDDGDGVPNWADKKPGKDDHADKKPSTSKGLSDKQKKLPPGLQKAIAKKTESVEVAKGVVTESADLIRMKQFLTRLNG